MLKDLQDQCWHIHLAATVCKFQTNWWYEVNKLTQAAPFLKGKQFISWLKYTLHIIKLQNVHYCVHNSPSLVFFLSQMNAVQFENLLNIILQTIHRSSKWSSLEVSQICWTICIKIVLPTRNALQIANLFCTYVWYSNLQLPFVNWNFFTGELTWTNFRLSEFLNYRIPTEYFLYFLLVTV
jgi:hypothetical protein